MDLSLLTTTAIAVPTIVIGGVVINSGYVKAPPDVAYIISGLKQEPRIVVGKATVKIPFFERLDKLSLRLIKVDVKTQDSVPTAEFININVDSVVMARIPNDVEMIQLAAKNFLNVGEDRIASAIVDVLQGNTREIVGSMKLKDMISDRKAFAEKVQENAVPDLKKMGIELISFTVQSFSDENGVIKDLGIENTSQIKKTASIAKAEAERDVAIAQAEADRAAKEAEADAEQRIAEKANAVAVRKAELKIVADTKKAEADAAYVIQKEHQRKTVEVTAVNASIAQQERNIELAQKVASVKEKELEGTVKKQADADLYKRMKEAEAEKFEIEQSALAELAKKKSEAEAMQILAFKEADAIRKKGEAEAYALSAKGKAEAEAIAAKGLAEAEAMQKKAEAYKQYNQAAVIEMLVKTLPEVAREVASPMSAIDKVTIYAGGEGSGITGMSNNVPVAVKQVFDTMKEATGVDMTDIVKSATIDAKTTRNINFTTNNNDIVSDIKEALSE